MDNTTKVKVNKSRYSSLDGIRAIGAIGIVMMHVKANGGYAINGFLYDEVIFRFGYLAFMFMILSAFSMCCGYFDKIINSEISIEKFYSRRYKRVLPYFSLLVLADFIMSPGIDTLMETFANITLCFSLLPNSNMSVIGVAWTLGVIFVFYLLFPFFCYLISNKRRAWMALICSVIFHFMCKEYFFDSTHVVEEFDADTNILYCAVYFMIGGVIYIYREHIERIVSKHIILSVTVSFVVSALLFALVEEEQIACMVSFALIICVAISYEGRLLNNKVAKFLSDISMEIYLCHMMIFRILEKTKFLSLFGNGMISYICVTILVLGISALFAYIAKKVLGEIELRWRKSK